MIVCVCVCVCVCVRVRACVRACVCVRVCFAKISFYVSRDKCLMLRNFYFQEANMVIVPSTAILLGLAKTVVDVICARPDIFAPFCLQMSISAWKTQKEAHQGTELQQKANFT